MLIYLKYVNKQGKGKNLNINSKLPEVVTLSTNPPCTNYNYISIYSYRKECKFAQGTKALESHVEKESKGDDKKAGQLSYRTASGLQG